jgi:hypothetical protein
MRSTIRLAKEGDLPRIRQLVHDDPDLRGIPAHRYVLVLDDDDGGLAAAAAVTIDDGRGHLGFVAIAPAHEGEHLGADRRAADGDPAQVRSECGASLGESARFMRGERCLAGARRELA